MHVFIYHEAFYCYYYFRCSLCLNNFQLVKSYADNLANKKKMQLILRYDQLMYNIQYCQLKRKVRKSMIKTDLEIKGGVLIKNPLTN